MKNNSLTENPFGAAFDTPHQTLPFNHIRFEHYRPAFEEAIKREQEEVELICKNQESPSFENTIVALERAGAMLESVSSAFFNLLSAETTPQMEALAQEISPLLTAHANEIMLNNQLFERVKAVCDLGEREDAEEQMLLNNTYSGFVRAGALLQDEQKKQLKALKEELSVLTLRFSQNLLQETNDYYLHLTAEEDIAGLPETQKQQAEMAAQGRELKGYVITLHAPSYIPFITHADNRERRRELYMAYNTRCTHDNDANNFDIVKRIVNIRQQTAQLLGYPHYAAFVLEKRMAQNSQAVYDLLDQLTQAYKETAQTEVKAVADYARSVEGEDFELQAWDFAYYAHKLKTQQYDFDPEALRPYFELSQVKKGVFGLAETLYGITFKENAAIPVYHSDVTAYEVFDNNGDFLAVLYVDFHPRESKQGGAWMTNYKEQWVEADGKQSRPQISLVMNFTKPAADTPALLSFEELETFLHEFGHALHGIFANSKFASMSGTNVYRDFVELPSQIMENFAVQKEFLQTFARHYKTGELIPEAYIERILSSRNFNVAYACLRQLSFGYLDMAYYTLTAPLEEQITLFEEKAMAPVLLLPKPKETCMSVQFSHIMSGGYATGYYGYKWAEILDADAFEVFQKHGILDRDTAQTFRKEILEKGGTKLPMALYKAFKGEAPTIGALLQRDGIKK